MSISLPCHPTMGRRSMLQAGSVGLPGLGMNHVAALRAADVVSQLKSGSTAKSVIFVFLSSGLTQHDSFATKPDAPEEFAVSSRRSSLRRRVSLFANICLCSLRAAKSGA